VGDASVSADAVMAPDPRFTLELVDQIDGHMRTSAVTTRTIAELAPTLASCLVTRRYRDSPEGLDMKRVISQVQDGLVPLFADMRGFILYGLAPTETDRAGINVRETEAVMEAGNQLVADWAARNQADPWCGEPVVHTGGISFADLATPGADLFRRATAAGRPTGRSPTTVCPAASSLRRTTTDLRPARPVRARLVACGRSRADRTGRGRRRPRDRGLWRQHHLPERARAHRRSHAHHAPRRLAVRLRLRHRWGGRGERGPVTTWIARLNV